MKKTSDKLKLFFGIAIASTAAVTVLRTLSILTAFESGIKYYARGAVLPYIQVALMVFATVAFAVIAILVKKNALPSERPATAQLSTFSSFLCGTVHASSTALLLLFQRGVMNTVSIIITVGLVLATVYFFYDALCSPEKKSPLCVLPAMAAVVGLVAIIVKIHLDYTVPLNSPIKSILFFTFAAVSLFIVQDLRFTVGRPMPRFYIMSAATALLLCAAMSIPGIIGHYTNVLSGGDFLIYCMISLAYGVYIFARLFTYIKYALFLSESETVKITADTVEISTETAE